MVLHKTNRTFIRNIQDNELNPELFGLIFKDIWKIIQKGPYKCLDAEENHYDSETLYHSFSILMIKTKLI